MPYGGSTESKQNETVYLISYYKSQCVCVCISVKCALCMNIWRPEVWDLPVALCTLHHLFWDRVSLSVSVSVCLSLPQHLQWLCWTGWPKVSGSTFLQHAPPSLGLHLAFNWVLRMWPQSLMQSFYLISCLSVHHLLLKIRLRFQ